MEDDDRRAAPLAAYAAAVCGGVFACLMLLAGPAQADEQDRAGDRAVAGLPDVEQAGKRIGAVPRDVGEHAAGLVREATAPIAPDVPVVEHATREVATTTDTVADGVERVTRTVERVDEPTPPAADPPPGDPPVAEAPDVGTDAAPGPAADEAPRRVDAPDAVRTWPAAETVPRGVLATRTAPAASTAAPAPVTVTVPLPSGPPPQDAVPAPGPSPLVPGCDDCGAATSPTGDPLHVFGLPAYGATTPRLAGTVPHDAAGGGPTTLVRRPDVSPD